MGKEMRNAILSWFNKKKAEKGNKNEAVLKVKGDTDVTFTSYKNEKNCSEFLLSDTSDKNSAV